MSRRTPVILILPWFKAFRGGSSICKFQYFPYLSNCYRGRNVLVTEQTCNHQCLRNVPVINVHLILSTTPNSRDIFKRHSYTPKTSILHQTCSSSNTVETITWRHILKRQNIITWNRNITETPPFQIHTEIPERAQAPRQDGDSTTVTHPPPQQVNHDNMTRRH